MVKSASGKLVLVAESRRTAAWIERSGRAPALVVHVNEPDGPVAAPPIAALPEARADAGTRRDPYVARAFALSVGGHLVLAAAIGWLLQQPVMTPPIVPIEIVFADAPGDVVVEDAGNPTPDQQKETPVAEAPVPAPEPPPQPVAKLPEPPVPEPPPPPVEEPPPVAETPPPPVEEPPPPPVAETPPEPLPPEPEPAPEIVKEPTPEPPPEVKVEKPPGPKVKPRQRPPRPKPVRLIEPRPVPVAAPAPAEIVREDTTPPKTDAGQITMTKEADMAPAAPLVSDVKVPQEAAVPVVNNPRFRRPPTPPRYPARAKEMEQQGTVVLRALVAADGTTDEITIWRSSGYPLLDDAAMRAVQAWAFEPARINGRSVEAWVEFPVNFRLR